MGGAIRSLPKCYCRRVFILILVLCGTQKQDFTRLMRLVEQVADREEVIIQAGHNHYETDKMKLFSFIPNDEMEKLYQQASLVVTHAGAGSILQGVKNHKKIIAVPRLKKYHEHVNDHQIELATKLEQLGCILTYQDGEDFISLYEKAKTFNPLPFNQKGNIEGLIDQSLEKYLK